LQLKLIVYFDNCLDIDAPGGGNYTPYISENVSLGGTGPW